MYFAEKSRAVKYNFTFFQIFLIIYVYLINIIVIHTTGVASLTKADIQNIKIYFKGGDNKSQTTLSNKNCLQCCQKNILYWNDSKKSYV